jgi:hypothetical protein
MGELMLMYTNLRQAGLGGFGYVEYWSSSEADNTSYAWTQNFRYGDLDDDYKYYPFHVRPVRAF